MMIKAELATLITLYILISFSTIIITTSSPPNFSIAKKDCKDRCGGVEIPYPFGIGPDCYLDKRFKIDCFTSSTTPETPFKSNVSTNLQVSSISVEEGSLELMMFIAHSCYDKSGRDSELSNNPNLQIVSPGFTLSATSNKFVVIGCDDVGSFVGRNSTQGKISRNGCISYCSTIDDIDDGSCNGIGCCEAPIPPGRSKLNITLLTFSKHSELLKENPCSYAFLIATKHFYFSKTNLTDLRKVERLPAVVDWVIGDTTCTEEKQNLISYACKGNSTVCVDNPDDDIGGYRCVCPSGFQGNPYLADCTSDIDECADENLHECVPESDCINEPVGNYTCNCKKGYEGDGRRDGEGCKRRASDDISKYYKIIPGLCFGVVMFILKLLHFAYKKRKSQQTKKKNFRDNGGLTLESQENKHKLKTFSINSLKKASNNFDKRRIVGEGSFGTVYKGYLPDKSVIAIKKAKSIDRNQIDSFINEMSVLSQTDHPNIVKLLGCCLETEIPIPVYEFVVNGNLYDHIHDHKNSSQLTFQMRLKIAVESVEGLSYMHSASPPIIHRDIKPANILLDKTYTAKVSDFGSSRIHSNHQTQISTMVQGTLGYLDPEYMQKNQLTEKSDVYSFGVLLIELFSGKKALDYDRPEEERSLANYFLTKLKNNETLFDDILDDCSISNEEAKELLGEIAKLAKECVNISGEQRPTMKEVATELKRITLIKCKDFNVGKNADQVEPSLMEGTSDSYMFDVNSITNASGLLHANNEVSGR